MSFPRLIFVKIFKYFQYNEPDGRKYKVYKLISLLNRECRYFIAPLFSYKITIDDYSPYDDFNTVRTFLKFNHQYHKADLTLDTSLFSSLVVDEEDEEDLTFRKIYLSHKYNIIPLVKKLIIGKYLLSWLDYFGPKSSSQIESLEIQYKEDRGEGFEKYLFKNTPFPISPDHLQTLHIASYNDLDVDPLSQIFQGYHHLEKLIFSYCGKYPIGPELNKFEKLSVLSHLSHLELDRVMISPNEFIEYLSTTTSNIETLILNSILLKDITDNNNNDINNSNKNSNSSIGLEIIFKQISHSKTIKTLKVINQYGITFPSIDIKSIIDLINRNSTLETIIYDTINNKDKYIQPPTITSTISNDNINNQTLKHLKINQSPIDIHTLWISNSNLRTIRILNEQQPISLFENPQTFHHQSIRKLHFQFRTTLQSLIEIIQLHLPTLTTIKISTQYNYRQNDIDFETIFTAISNNNNIDSISIKCSIKIYQFRRLIERNIKHLRKIHVNLSFTAKVAKLIGSSLNQNTNIQEFSFESWSDFSLIIDMVLILLECKHLTSIKCHGYGPCTRTISAYEFEDVLKLNLDHLLHVQIYLRNQKQFNNTLDKYFYSIQNNK
ncbi:vacuolar protein sorting-associated protein 13 family protein [Tieghemostelium lacteum]|uniref:Vacuolar protein sorting-associated protein 13 family protein n=1 Tax=Tieghemostelium lacteum TaxID=361077 RepID=A0A151Z6C4_TIELA|nr:vacuolar protein sorting-associated protein 13 family protein [Tieghemostelium lacteum]|eukprot:KYQ89495.1 vacuolar protein sorting-associated protein 13 family protein [Tieghemostelium lacteum]